MSPLRLSFTQSFPPGQLIEASSAVYVCGFRVPELRTSFMLQKQSSLCCHLDSINLILGLGRLE